VHQREHYRRGRRRGFERHCCSFISPEIDALGSPRNREAVTHKAPATETTIRRHILAAQIGLRWRASVEPLSLFCDQFGEIMRTTPERAIDGRRIGRVLGRKSEPVPVLY
jgi:hypothetical protein